MLLSHPAGFQKAVPKTKIQINLPGRSALFREETTRKSALLPGRWIHVFVLLILHPFREKVHFFLAVPKTSDIYTLQEKVHFFPENFGVFFFQFSIFGGQKFRSLYPVGEQYLCIWSIPSTHATQHIGFL